MSSFQAYSATSLSASQTVENFNAVRGGNILPKAGAGLSETTGAHDIGSSTYKWSSGFIGEVASSVTVSAPVTFTGRATFNTSTTFSSGLFPQRVSVSYIVAAGISPTTYTSTAFILEWNTVTANTIVGASLTTNQVSLPSGTYIAYARLPGVMSPGTGCAIHLFDATASLSVADICSMSGDTTVYGVNIAKFTLATLSSIEARAENEVTAAWFAGFPWSDGQYKNVYAQMTIFKVS